MGTDRSGLRVAPTRTCVGCRRTDSWSALLRVVAEQGPEGRYAVLAPDPNHVRPGRGAWLHPRTDCLSLALRRKAFGRALRLQAPTDPTALQHWVDSRLTQQASTTAHPSSETTDQGGLDADEHPMSTQQ